MFFISPRYVVPALCSSAESQNLCLCSEKKTTTAPFLAPVCYLRGLMGQ